MDKERDKMQESNEFQQVLERYENMLRKSHASFFDVEEFEYIIDYYLDQRDLNHAVEASEYAKKQHPNSPEITVKIVQVNLENGKPLLALEQLNSLPLWHEEDSELHLLKGTALVQLGKIREAEKFFDKAVKLAEDDKIEILLNISMTFENIRQFTYAVKYLLLAWELETDNLAVLYDLGYYYERLHNFQQSLIFYNRYLDEDPFSDNVWFNVGVVLYKLHENKKAIDAYDFAIAINPSYASAYFNKANIYAEDGDFNNAVNVYQEFLSLEPEHIQAWCYLGECYEEMGDYNKALEVYKKTIEIDNTNPEGWFGAGISLMYQGKLEDSSSYLHKAIEFDNQNPEFWFTLAEVYEKMGLIPEAIKCLKQTTKLDNTDHEAWIKWASLHFGEEDYANALVVLMEAYQYNFNIPRILYYIAGLHFNLNDSQTGLRFLEKALATDEKDLDEFYLLYPEGKKNPLILNLIKK
jgi:tetratricopeptide (TPR) repeat protein